MKIILCLILSSKLWSGNARMTEKETLSFINKIEEKYPVEQWNINGVHIWPLIRLRLGHQLLFGEDVAYEVRKRNSYGKVIKRAFERLLNFFKLYICDCDKNSHYNGEEILAVINNVNRDIKLKGGRWYNQIVNPICESLENAGKRIFYLEYIANSSNIRMPRFNKSKIINFELICYILKDKLNIFKKNDAYLPRYDEFISYCNANGLNTDNFYVTMLANRLLAEKKFFLKLLQGTNINLILLSNWSSVVEMGLTMAAKQLGIRCMYINHGYYSIESFYNFGWSKEPEGLYECRPNYYWCWTEKSALVMNQELPNGKAIYGGPPYVLAWQNGLKNKLDSINVELEKNIPKGKKVVLFTLSNDDVGREVYPDWLFDVVKATEVDYFWLFRKHKAFWGTVQDEICREVEHYCNVEWRMSSRLPLLQLLEISDVHVTYNSSTLIEAEAMGVNTVIFSEMWQDRYAEQLANGTAVYANSKDSMIKKLDECCKNKRKIRYENGVIELLKLLEY